MADVKKKAPGKADAKKGPPPVTLAQELHVDTDLRRLADACGQLGDFIGPFAKRVKSELVRVKDGDQDGVPHVALFVHGTIPYEEVQLMCAVVLPPYPYLREVKLHHCQLGDDGILVLTDFLKMYKVTPDKNPFGIECLELPGSAIGPRGAGYIGKMLSENATIARLVLDFNSSLTDDGVAALCNGLRWNGTLQHLSMQYCSITSQGAGAVASGVIKGSNVKVLSLRGNPIKDDGIVDIGRALGVGTNIEVLDLADTCFGTKPETVEVLCEGMETSISLKNVNLDLNTVAPASAQAILSAVRKNTNLAELVLSDRVDSEVYKEILDAVVDNYRKNNKAKKGKKAAKAAG